MKLGGLFSGIGGFELAWQRHGGTVAWMCEIDPAARKVLEARFPGVPIYADVSEVDPDEVEPVDVLTGGSPCQGFSIAGGRKGMEHQESRLFADYVRILDGLAQRGLSWAVWENVPGVLSISNDTEERTFPHVVAALVGANEPVRLDGTARWNTGLAARDGRAVAWRVLDSRHFGVPQRRRRVYACVAVGGAAERRAFGALLALPEGVSRDTAACQQEGQDVAGTLTASAGSGGADDNRAQAGHIVGSLTTGASDGGGWRAGPDEAAAGHVVPDVAHALTRRADSGEDGTGRGTPIIPDTARTLTSHGQRIDGESETFIPIATSSATDVLTSEDYTQPITGRNGDPGSVLAPMLMTMREDKDGGGKGPLLSEDESLTLATGNGQVLFAPEVASTLTHGTATTGNPPGRRQEDDANLAATSYGVRRLTPTECERLQSFPDGWTEPAGSDSARYRALGNAVTVNVPAWLFGRMLADEQSQEVAA